MTATATIFALASGAGRAAVAIIRVSGPATASAVQTLAGTLPQPRQATLVALRHPGDGTLLDRGLVLWFPAPHSFTGENCAELQVHGSHAVVSALLEALGALPDCRLAEPGEFTRRAFLNGKMDLAAVEGLADLIDAETDAQRRQALRQLDGAVGRWIETLRDGLLYALALAESAIDFADEGDIGVEALAEAVGRAATVAAMLEQELAKPRRGERIRDGFVVTLAGPPNAGKSTLLNLLAQRQAAIVSPHPGTTRDPIEVDLDLGGYAVLLIDTAGVRDTTDPVEQEGVARARARMETADLVLWLQDATEAPAPPLTSGQTWTVGTKSDLLNGTARAGQFGFDIMVSAVTGQGMPDLIERLTSLVAGTLAGGDAALITRLRHRHALEDATSALKRIAGLTTDPELVAEHLRDANAALGRITGRIGTEEILGAIFSRFCIGK